jgi:hypothetical protein
VSITDERSFAPGAAQERPTVETCHLYIKVDLGPVPPLSIRGGSMWAAAADLSAITVGDP